MSSAVQAAVAALEEWDRTHAIQPGDRGMESMRFHQTQAQRDKDLTTYLNRLGREKAERGRLERAWAQARYYQGRLARIENLAHEAIDNPQEPTR